MYKSSSGVADIFVHIYFKITNLFFAIQATTFLCFLAEDFNRGKYNKTLGGIL